MPPKPAKSDDDDEATGFNLLVQTLYQEAFAYQSIKMMKIFDYRLTCAHPASLARGRDTTQSARCAAPLGRAPRAAVQRLLRAGG